jgi:hypothetical protein
VIKLLYNNHLKGAVIMTKRTRRNHGSVFKAKVALEAIKGADLKRTRLPLPGPSQSDYTVEATTPSGSLRDLREEREIKGT